VDSWEFGRTVRHWRERIAPATVGVAEGRRHRATGLRREEVAELAGISVDYLTRLEQGRATSPSAQAAAPSKLPTSMPTCRLDWSQTCA
jgi:hypothetical protein